MDSMVISALIAAIVGLFGGFLGNIYLRIYLTRLQYYAWFVSKFVPLLNCVAQRGITENIIGQHNILRTEYEVAEMQVKLYASPKLLQLLNNMRNEANIPYERPMFLINEESRKQNNITLDEHFKQLNTYFSIKNYEKILDVIRKDSRNLEFILNID